MKRLQIKFHRAAVVAETKVKSFPKKIPTDYHKRVEESIIYYSRGWFYKAINNIN